jgi:hypothetical protein
MFAPITLEHYRISRATSCTAAIKIKLRGAQKAPGAQGIEVEILLALAKRLERIARFFGAGPGGSESAKKMR